MGNSNFNIQVVDLFCGVGGLTYGLNQVGLKVVAGIDIDGSCAKAYEKNNDAEFIQSDISELDSTYISSLYSEDTDYKVLVGCAPCQPFSTHSNKKLGKETDERWNLVLQFAKKIEEIRPSVVSMENVPGLAKQDVFFEFLKKLEDIGYFVSYKVVFCPDYGIPQNRRRLVLMASNLGEISLIPPTHDRKSAPTLKDVIGHLKPIKHGAQSKRDLIHASSSLSELNYKRMLASKPGGSWLDWDESLLADCHKRSSGSSFKSVYGRLSWESQSSTITTQFYRFGTGRFGHPEQHRALSLREGAILQTFPENYDFLVDEDQVNFSKIGRQIGNAVPPKLGEVVGKSILQHLNLVASSSKKIKTS